MENKKDMSLIKIIKKIFPMIFRSCPILTIFVLMIGVLYGLSIAVNTFATQHFFDKAAMAIKGEATARNVIIMAIVLGLVMIITQILSGTQNYIYEMFILKIEGHFYKRINDKCGRIDPVTFEDTELLDRVNKAKKGVRGSVLFFVSLSFLIAFYLPYFLAMGIYLFKLDKILSLIILAIFVPVALSQVIRVKLFSRLENEVAPIRREYEYYEKAVGDREYFKETRMLGGFKYFRELYESSLKLLGSKSWKAEKKTGLLELLMKGITLLGYLIVLYLLARSLFKGNITIGAFTAVFASIDRIIKMMEEIICRRISKLTRDIGTVENFINFFDLPERGGENIEISADDGIYLKNVSFTYPSARASSINGVNLEINPKETIAIVGENGAGKSTLVKLITGLYLPTEGSVQFGKIDTRKISTESIYKHTSGVFQNYQKYKMSLEENITISDSGVNSREILRVSTERADINVESENFPQGYDTMLSCEFDGVDLSGGQWQRVAIARGFYKAHKMIVLDEPTAAIDPVEETNIYEKFASISKGKTSIIVTHRLGSAKIADRIVVMDKGRIVEVGTHKELMELKGKYAEMYEAQAQWYVRDDEVEKIS